MVSLRGNQDKLRLFLFNFILFKILTCPDCKLTIYLY